MTTIENNNRAPREADSRESSMREMPWQPPTALPDPSPRPGITHRWVRTATYGQSDVVNFSLSQREGWSPVLAADYPELRILSDHGTRWPDGIEVGGLLLCSAPVAVMAKRAEYYAAMAQGQMKSVDDQLEAEEHPRYRTFVRESESTTTRGFGLAQRRPTAPNTL